ncbi:hypothetical protein Ddye_018006 [Dipteronia dyeriana]|uniref:VLRF1 domain-containing protein n=1 Tax=Dipteronia dyeriana TaxID=168575 RepID=A0AAD9UAH1_9ROSI|nr:hypothetical protein Ddye_018006 [Dipteronia dyeriana]
MATETTTASQDRRRSIFDVPPDFFESCRLLSPSATSVSDTDIGSEDSALETLDENEDFEKEEKSSDNGVVAFSRWTCNTCQTEFECLEEQRSHFKSDIHRFNVKLTFAGKDIVKEEDLDELTSDSFKDYEISSISGSEDECDKVSHRNNPNGQLVERLRKKLFIRLKTGERVSIWKCLLLNESESVSYENDKADSADDGLCLRESEVIERLNLLIHEPRDNTRFRVVLLARAGHFAGCIFDGNLVVVHKTFHRYVVRAKAGKKQSTKDASGRTVHSAGASLRRYNELALKKDIQELLSSWKPYFDASFCVFIYAPSTNRQLLFNGEKPYFCNHRCAIKNIPLTVKRPTFKETQYVYKQLTQVAYEEEAKVITPDANEKLILDANSVSDAGPSFSKEDMCDNLELKETIEASSSCKQSNEQCVSSESENEVIGMSTALHEAAQSNNAQKVLELLEHGLDPCIKDDRGRTAYMLTTEKEVRNSFRRFMASNLDKWDWHAAKVPSALTKEMEESQAAKQAEKDAKKKARAKELKKLRKAREKKTQAEAALSQNAATAVENQFTSSSVIEGQSQPASSQISKEEELKRVQATEREKRAAAAERRMAAASTTVVPSTSQPKMGLATDVNCSCCGASLAGKVPFHRYNYKYCSTTCMHVHREALEDG